MFEDLKKNIEHEKRIVSDINSVLESMSGEKGSKKFYTDSLKSLAFQLRLLNKAVPELLKESSPVEEVKEKVIEEKKEPKKKKVVKMSYVSPSSKEKKFITINKMDREMFLQQLKLSEDNLKHIRRVREKKVGGTEKKVNAYAKLSNRFFRNTSEKLVPRLDSLGKDLKKGNVNILLVTYISMALMSTTIAFFVVAIFYLLLIFVAVKNVSYFWIVIVLPLLTAFGFYYYPSSESNDVKKKITQELPFATIHMAAIAGSNITPSEIFKIISNSKEYPAIGKEVRKILVQIEIYGYDLVTSLKNVATRTPNKQLSELFSGLATNISTGGELKNYLNKKADNFLLDYRLERQKYSALAETFMDIYISVLIAAPLVMMMMFVVMNVAGLGMGGITLSMLLLLSIFGVIVVNIIFLVVLNMKQPKV